MVAVKKSRINTKDGRAKSRPKKEIPKKARATAKNSITTSKPVKTEVQKADNSAKTQGVVADAKAVSDAWNILKYPYLTEKSTRMIESQNKLVFIVKDRSTKAQIKGAVEAVFGVKVADVNTTSTMRGEKKAYIRLKPEFKAVDIATKLGMM